jgi:3' terminal RNA ribose 2'-O-methyltransferase Hen1
MSVAIAQVLGAALGGRSRERQELADSPIPLEARLAVLPCRGGPDLLRSLFEPLGYEVEAQRHVLDEQYPDWGPSPYFTVTLRATCRLRDLLSHLYVLIPVLDDEKHYWVGDDEVEELLRHGQGWLENHPERERITRRYLKHQPSLARQALARLVAEETPDPDAARAEHDAEEAVAEEKISLNTQRMGTVLSVLKGTGARRVLDLGCGEGRLLEALLAEKQFEEIVGLDVSCRALEMARERLHLDRLPPRQQQRIKLLHGSLIYRDARLSGYDAALAIEVVEHFDPARLSAFERVLFEFARPGIVILTTPNREYNSKWESLAAGRFRHRDHRFEWTRDEFRSWATAVADRFGYSVRFLPVGPEDSVVGAPTQMAVFEEVSG